MVWIVTNFEQLITLHLLAQLTFFGATLNELFACALRAVLFNSVALPRRSAIFLALASTVPCSFVKTSLQLALEASESLFTANRFMEMKVTQPLAVDCATWMAFSSSCIPLAVTFPFCAPSASSAFLNAASQSATFRS